MAAILHLHQEARHFWDFVAFACVVGGTLSVAVITFPWQYRREIAATLLRLAKPSAADEGAFLAECIEFLRSLQGGAMTYDAKSGGIAGDILRDGAELIGLGFEPEKVHEILEERIHQSFERGQKISNSVRALAKYPPAFGLAGTVLGLVTLMRKVSEGADAKQTGVMMAIALMATFYGLLTANLIVNPAGEYLAKAGLLERKKAEIALHAVALYMHGATLLEAQETLNSYVAKDKRISVIALPAEAA
jgi:chemotaxis protein MotA